MSCACCDHDDSRCGAPTGESRHAGKPAGDDDRARTAVRLLALRFALSSALFAFGLVAPLLIPSAAAYASLPFFVASWLVSGFGVLASVPANIMKGRVFDENFLMSVATLGAFAVGQWSEGAAVMLFFNLGEIVQESAVSKSRRSIRELMDVRPDVARVETGATGEGAGAGAGARTVETHPAKVAPGSVIVVYPGEKVPLDGMVIDGVSSFDTSRLTGESLPRDVAPGSEALAGFVNGEGSLRVRTTASFSETAAAKMLELIENAQNRKAKAERMITSFARAYTPIVTVAALLLALVPPLALAATGAAGGKPAALDWAAFSPWTYRALVFLVISCPCAFVISVPLGFFGGIGGAARLGVLVKGADFIDALAATRAVVFDKTGTLTKGEFRVRSAECAEGVTGRELAEAAALAESRSNHPVASAIRAHAASFGAGGADEGRADASVTDARERAGFGATATVGGVRYAAGSRRLMEEEGVAAFGDANADRADRADAGDQADAAGTVVEVARDGVRVGRLTLGDSPKDDAAAAVAELASLGIRDVTMVTGDSEAVARSVARELGIQSFRAGALPHEKVALFEEIDARAKRAEPKGTTLFVGDGINDAPVLARADAGVAMGALGSDAAIEAADVVLMNDSPLSVATAIRSARWTRRIVSQNIALAFAVKIGFLALGAFGLATLWEAVFADVGVALLATLNSLRARKLPARSVAAKK